MSEKSIPDKSSSMHFRTNLQDVTSDLAIRDIHDKDKASKMAWIVSRLNEIQGWAESFYAAAKSREIFSSFSAWLSYHYYEPPKNTDLEKLLCDPEVIHLVLEYYCKKNEAAHIPFFWTLLAAQGSLLWLDLREYEVLRTILKNNIDLVTAAFYPAIFHANGELHQQGIAAIETLLVFQPLERSIAEFHTYSTLMLNDDCVMYSIPFCANYFQLFFFLEYCLRNKAANLLSLFESRIVEPQCQIRWGEFKKIFKRMEQDDELCLLGYLTDLYSKRDIPDHKIYFSEVWTSLLDEALRKNATKCISVLMDLKNFPEAESFVPLSSLGIPLMENNFEQCEALLHAIDCTKLENMNFDQQISVLLQQFCIMRSYKLFMLLFPIDCVRFGKEAVLEYIASYHVKVVRWLASLVRAKDPQNQIKSAFIWAAFSSGNSAIADALVEMGAVAQWMDSSSGKNKNATQKSDPVYKVDDASSCLFRAYGGETLVFYDKSLVDDQFFEECSSLSNLYGPEYAKTMRGSAVALNGPVEKIEFQALPRLGGKKRTATEVKSKQMSNRIRLNRKQTVAHQNSDQIWKKFTELSITGAERMLREPHATVEWMEANYESDTIGFETSLSLRSGDLTTQFCALY
jgi:hypothetical protein